MPEMVTVGSKWTNGYGEVVTVKGVQTVVQYSYENRAQLSYNWPLNGWEARYTKVEHTPKRGETYQDLYYTFVVGEVVDLDNGEGVMVFGREKSIDDAENYWYPESYSIKQFRGRFKESDRVEDET